MSCDNNIRFIIRNCIPDADVYSNNESPIEMLPINIKNERRGKIWRCTELSESVILGGYVNTDHSIYQVISAFALIGHNITPAGSVILRLYIDDGINRVEVYNSDSMTVSAIKPLGEFVFGVDSWGNAVTDFVNPTHSLFFSDVMANSFEIEIDDQYNPDGYIDIRQIFIGEALILDNNFDYGLSIQWQNAQELRRTEGGSLLTIGNNNVWRELLIPLNLLTDWDRQRLTLQARSFPGRSIFVSAYPGADEADQREFSMAAKIVPSGYSHSGFGEWSNNMTLEEV